jgi:DNA-binding MarR family transcriptional regulator
MKTAMDLPDVQYQRLLEFRTGIRQFLKWSARQAAEAGITGPQHQLLLAIRGHRAPRPPSIGDLSNILVERQHSVSGLVDRASAAGLVRRVTDPDDRRVVRVALTPKGKQKLERLTTLHIEELKRFGPSLRAVWHGLVED